MSPDEPGAPPRTWSFSGREDDLTTALAAIRTAGAVVLAGPPGVGKSRLALEMVGRLGPEHLLGVVRATASARAVPFGSLLDVLPPLGPDRPPDPEHLHLAVQALGPRDGRDLLLVDDAHLLDELSASAVHRLPARGVRLVLTVRAGEPAPDAVTALWKDDLARRVELAPFGPAGTAELLASALGGPVEVRTGRRLHHTTQGNVLWLRHLVDGERAAGRLRREAGVWTWTGDGALPTALTDLVAAHIGVLPAEQHRVLELLSTTEPIGLDMLTDLAGATAVEEVAQRGLVLVEPDGERWEVRLAHPLYGEVVRARTTVPRARRLHGELSAALAATGSRRTGDDLRRAVLGLGGDRPLDAPVLLDAAVQASGLGDFPLAERLLRAAVDAGGGFEARAGLAHLLGYLLRGDEVDAVLDASVAEAATPRERARALALQVLHHQIMATTPREGTPLIDAVEAAENGGRPDPAHAAIRSTLLAFDGRVPESLALADGVLADPARPVHDVALAAWPATYGRAFTGAGLPGDLVARGIAATAHTPEMAAMACNLGFAEVLDADLRGRPDEARGRVEWVRGLPGAQAPVFVALYEGRQALSTGRPGTARRSLTACLPAFPGHGGGWGAWIVAMVARCHALQGDAPAARSALAEAESRRHPFAPVLEFEIDLARGWVCATAGDVPGGIAALQRGAGRCAERGLHAVEVLLRQDAVRLGDRTQAARLGELHRLVGSPRAAAAAEHAAALDARDIDRLLAVADRSEAAGTVLEALDAAAQAAATARAAGRLVPAALAAERAWTLAAATEGTHTPALLGAEAPVPLSAREREVALLAADGLTNRQIADRLHVSVRTVESHVYRACSRLGLTDRADLIALVRAPGRVR